MGLRKGSPWTHLISLKILELHEGGQMEKLDNKWILVESTDCPQRDHTPATLGLTNMAGKSKIFQNVGHHRHLLYSHYDLNKDVLS